MNICLSKFYRKSGFIVFLQEKGQTRNMDPCVFSMACEKIVYAGESTYLMQVPCCWGI
jgi:hypothetical protein